LVPETGSYYSFEINENRSVKTLPYTASRVTKHSERNKNNLWKGERFLYMRHVCRGDYYFGPRNIDRDLQRIKLGTVAWDGSAPTEGRWEGGNPSLSHAKCTLIK
jgi:hypothetical protein